MKRVTTSFIALLATATLGLAADYSGKLIDANCSAAQNPSPDSKALAQCAPTSQTKSFAVQTADGKVIKLDSDGNKKAEEALKSDPTKTDVTVSGSMNGQMLKVDSINLR